MNAAGGVGETRSAEAMPAVDATHIDAYESVTIVM